MYLLNSFISIFQLVLAVDAVYARNTLQFMFLMYVLRGSITLSLY
jgi:hypothetical protein